MSRLPVGASITERAIPVIVFASKDKDLRQVFLRKWTGGAVGSGEDGSLLAVDILDWNYYIERLGRTIQKIITIPAALQRVSNPVPGIAHPDWLTKQIKEQEQTAKQTKISRFFPRTTAIVLEDMEDLAGKSGIGRGPQGVRAKATLKKKGTNNNNNNRNNNNNNNGNNNNNNNGNNNGNNKIKAPDMDKDFHSWLKFKKREWRQLREKKKIKRKSLANTNTSTRQAPGEEGQEPMDLDEIEQQGNNINNNNNNSTSTSTSNRQSKLSSSTRMVCYDFR